MLIQDFYDDSTWLHDMCARAGLEKQAGANRSEVAGLPMDQFGGTFRGSDGSSYTRFPMHTPEHLQLSAAYLVAGQHNLNKTAAAQVARNMMEGFFGHHIRPPKELSKLASPNVSWVMDEVASLDYVTALREDPIPEAAYAVKIAGVHRFPVRNKSEAESAIGWFESSWKDIPAEHRRVMATAFEKKASLFGADSGKAQQKYLGEERSWLFKAAMEGRSAVAPEYRKMYMGLVTSEEPLDVLSEKLAEIDTLAKLNTLWDSALGDPWTTVYDNTVKLAAKAYKKVIGGEIIRGEDLERVIATDAAYLENLLGASASQKFFRNPVTFFDKADTRLQRIIVNITKNARIEAR